MTVRHDRPECVCGHAFDAHEHYRPGSDCGACGHTECPAYCAPSKFTSLLLRNRQLKRRLAEAEARIAEDERLWRNLRALAPFAVSRHGRRPRIARRATPPGIPTQRRSA